ncbi:DUF2946 domain-containing protein [Pseudomonas syringae]|nr:DUF2946 domain-containing protein [Pseudomonas syringae]MBD8803176.1 DUF2946 domain-containing protein [Pseudomonas syringae]MBD8813996.1 DUF2946 domain-containing protein [Pseudomonas syringae]
MNSHRLRPLIAWTLYACVLFNLLSCAIVHGQMSALALSGLGGQFCSESSTPPGDSGKDLGVTDTSGMAGQAGCLICGAALAVVLLLMALAWPFLRTASASSPEPRCKAPPRYSWPSANPRASPLTFVA